MNMTRLLVRIESENAKSKPGADAHVCVVATPLVICQIQSNGQATEYRRGPSVCPTLHFLRPSLFLGNFPEPLDDSGVGGTDRLVGRLPMRLLTLLGLCIETRAGEKEVQCWHLTVPCVWRD